MNSLYKEVFNPSGKFSKGFTLIELLVVIAIIAILVVLVVAAINPLERLRDASDRTAAGNVRTAATLVSTCITQQIANGTPIATIYSNTAYVAATQQGGCAAATTLAVYGTSPAGVTYPVNAAIRNICASAANPNGHFTPAVWNYSTGVSSDPRTAAGVCL